MAPGLLCCPEAVATAGVAVGRPAACCLLQAAPLLLCCLSAACRLLLCRPAARLQSAGRKRTVCNGSSERSGHRCGRHLMWCWPSGHPAQNNWGKSNTRAGSIRRLQCTHPFGLPHADSQRRLGLPCCCCWPEQVVVTDHLPACSTIDACGNLQECVWKAERQRAVQEDGSQRCARRFTHEAVTCWLPERPCMLLHRLFGKRGPGWLGARHLQCLLYDCLLELACLPAWSMSECHAACNAWLASVWYQSGFLLGSNQTSPNPAPLKTPHAHTHTQTHAVCQRAELPSGRTAHA